MEPLDYLKACRICLTIKKPMFSLFTYNPSGNYAEMLTSVADVKVSATDGLPGKICVKCTSALQKAFFLKTVAEKNDIKLRKYLVKIAKSKPPKKIAFNSIKDIKSEISDLSVKQEPKWELEIDENPSKPVETIDGKDIVIANTVIRKLDLTASEVKPSTNLDEEANFTCKPTKSEESHADFFDGFQDDADDDDYVPPSAPKVKKPKLVKMNASKIRLLKKVIENGTRIESGGKATTITCYPIMKNGTRGPPITLKRPKDATILKFTGNRGQISVPNKPVRIVKAASNVIKTREKLVCPVCGILTYTLGNHMSTHAEKKKYNCTECPKTFAQKANLEAHIKQHNGIKDHICEVCGAGFYNHKSLARHNLIHKGERPFACNLCNKTFIARCDLSRHLRIHSGYKPFKCETCSMSFNAKHQLQNHERMHTGERPYTCQVCNVAFSYKVNLNNHVIKTHGVNLKFKSIHTVTQEVLQREMTMVNEASVAISHIMPPLSEAPQTTVQSTIYTSQTHQLHGSTVIFS